MTDYFAAAMWALVASVFLTNAVYALLLAHYSKEPILAALSWMFFALALGTGMIGLLRTGWGIMPLSMLKIIERAAFIVAAVNGWAVVQLATGRWGRSDTARRITRWWNNIMEVGI